MKALTLWRPWAKYVATGEKRIENRPWAPPLAMLGEIIAIHAGQKWDPKGVEHVKRVLGVTPVDDVHAESPIHPTGIVAIARIIGWTNVEQKTLASIEWGTRASGPQLALRLIDCQWMLGPVCWLLHVQQLVKPIPCRGMQKLWTLPKDIERQVREAPKHPGHVQ